jgi:hypothetical protein
MLAAAKTIHITTIYPASYSTENNLTQAIRNSKSNELFEIKTKFGD